MKGVKTIYNYFLDFGDDKEIVIPEGKADGTDVTTFLDPCQK